MLMIMRVLRYDNPEERAMRITKPLKMVLDWLLEDRDWGSLNT